MLLRAAERFARAKQIPCLVRIIELLIREDQRHALLLRACMQDHGMPCLELRHSRVVGYVAGPYINYAAPITLRNFNIFNTCNTASSTRMSSVASPWMHF